MPQPRNPLTYLIIGSLVGVILGAVIGIAIGSGGRSSAAIRVQTVVSTQTVHVAGLGPQVTDATPPIDSTPTVKTHATDTTATDTTASTPTDTTTTDTTATTTDTTATDTTTTDTTTTPPAPNDVPPPDPNNPPRGFCNSHVCGPGFSRGTGSAVECADGVWTKKGGQPGACRNDGGLA